MGIYIGEHKVSGASEGIYMPLVSVAYAAKAELGANVRSDIAVLEGDIEITLGAGIQGRDNEWVFIIEQPADAHAVTLPEIQWGELDSEPAFAPGTVTVCRVYKVKNKFLGEWVTVT